MIFRREVLAILAGQVFVLRLFGQWSRVLLATGRFFLRRRTRRNAAFPTVEGRVILVHDYSLGVNVGYIRDADVGDGAVVEKCSAAPFASAEAHAAVAESVVNPAIEADVRPQYPACQA